MKRGEFLKHATRLMDTPYLWGGRLLAPDTQGLDCWGMVAVAAMRAHGPKQWLSWWTDRAWMEFEPAFVVDAGVLAFYGGEETNPNDVGHVALHMGNGTILTTTRGTSACVTLEISKGRNAKVTCYSTEEYESMRHDFRGLRKIPFTD